MTRSFSLWKSQLVLWLSSLPDKGRIGTFVFKDQRNYLLTRLRDLRARWLASFLVDLLRFCDFWNIQLPSDLPPTKEELEEWMRTEIEIQG